MKDKLPFDDRLHRYYMADGDSWTFLLSNTLRDAKRNATLNSLSHVIDIEYIRSLGGDEVGQTETHHYKTESGWVYRDNSTPAGSYHRVMHELDKLMGSDLR